LCHFFNVLLDLVFIPNVLRLMLQFFSLKLLVVVPFKKNLCNLVRNLFIVSFLFFLSFVLMFMGKCKGSVKVSSRSKKPKGKDPKV
jgi:hypothetical protein